VSTLNEAILLIEKGYKERATSTTLLNDRSSRSHTIITFEIVWRKFQNPENNKISVDCENKNPLFLSIGKLHLVDLAGSERVKMSGATGQSLEEAKQINKALSVLGDVLNSLSKYHLSVDSSRVLESLPKPFIPFRNSKLTMLLKDSLGGNSKTMMVTTIRPLKQYYQQSLTALRYAARAKYIRNAPTQNIRIEDSTNNQSQIKKTLDEVARLKNQLDLRTKETEILRNKLKRLESRRQEHSVNQQNPLKAHQAEGLLGKEELLENKSLELRYQSEMEKLSKQNYLEKQQLQKHLQTLMHAQQGQLVKKVQEFEKLEIQLNDQRTLIDSLDRQKDDFRISLQRAETLNTELKLQVIVIRFFFVLQNKSNAY